MTYKDPYVPDDFTRAMDEIVEQRRAPGALRLLIDRQDAAAPTTDCVQRVVSFIADHPAPFVRARIAIVGASDITFGMGRMLQMRVAQSMPTMDVEVFRDRTDAESWLAQSERSG